MNAPTPGIQPQTITPFKCPALVGVVQQSGPNFVPLLVREIGDAEDKEFAKHTKDLMVNRQRFSLFVIVKRNYAEWLQYTTGLLKPIDGLSDDELSELDRLMLNFLSSARSLIDHFGQYYKQSHRNTPEDEKYSEYISKLETHSWAFGFFQDLRNFTQHCGLPIGRYSRTASRHAINLKIVADANWLLANSNPSRDWKTSKLTAARGELDLIELTQEYHHRLTQDLGGFVAKAFGPKLIDAHNFFALLAKEVETKHPGTTMAIAESYSITGNNIQSTCKYPPADLLNSLGITYTSKKSLSQKARTKKSMGKST
jgi:hypothetical protein